MPFAGVTLAPNYSCSQSCVFDPLCRCDQSGSYLASHLTFHPHVCSNEQDHVCCHVLQTSHKFKLSVESPPSKTLTKPGLRVLVKPDESQAEVLCGRSKVLGWLPTCKSHPTYHQQTQTVQQKVFISAMDTIVPTPEIRDPQVKDLHRSTPEPLGSPYRPTNLPKLPTIPPKSRQANTQTQNHATNLQTPFF